MWSWRTARIVGKWELIHSPTGEEKNNRLDDKDGAFKRTDYQGIKRGPWENVD